VRSAGRDRRPGSLARPRSIPRGTAIAGILAAGGAARQFSAARRRAARHLARHQVWPWIAERRSQLSSTLVKWTPIFEITTV
jgi:hypothetical protein